MEENTFDRVLTEFKELKEKIDKLTNFLLKESDSVDNLNKDLLIAQLKAMETYLTILSIRIGLNTPKIKQEEVNESVGE